MRVHAHRACGLSACVPVCVCVRVCAVIVCVHAGVYVYVCVDARRCDVDNAKSECGLVPPEGGGACSLFVSHSQGGVPSACELLAPNTRRMLAPNLQ